VSLRSCPTCGHPVDSSGFCPGCGFTAPSAEATPRSGFEWKTRAAIFGIPLVHIAFGRDCRGRLKVAKGVIAVGHIAFGLFTVAQFGVGILLGIGQFVCGLIVFGQVALGIIAGIGQLAVGYLAVGQFVVGIYGLGQFGWAKYLWSPYTTDMDAVARFHTIQLRIRQFLGLPW
jgi:hypothetical protein